ncbi:MAG: SPFH domain-containing protein, partial [Allosphingosinicella sp.]
MTQAIELSSGVHDLRLSRERQAHTMSGYPMLVAALAALAVAGLGGWRLSLGEEGLGLASLVGGALAFAFLAAGFYFLQPNQAAAILLFGDYRGTDRTAGLRWRLPWLTRTKISTRIHNITSDKLKVNDLRGNPIEIAANVVWRVTDTAQALFDVDNYMEFVE